MPHTLTQRAPSATAVHLHTSHQSIASGGVAACTAQCDLVVARCDEDLSWVSSAATLFVRVFIYNKCGRPTTHLSGLHNVQLIESPNVGSVGALLSYAKKATQGYPAHTLLILDRIATQPRERI